ncbi:MAG: chromosome segregation protein SMC [Gemmatimonadetes bacterium]|nr:chromosome segregation protein SMC [Gemmatimonadota bacterium]
MRLKALQLQGFKSFPDRTELEFHPGITAIVGPNGCGKSNISDAIRWVLGEQRPSAIRGARMEEAIFQGTVSRRPVNRGSVTMVLTNEDGLFPVPFGEVEISRTVFRGGGSEYALNRSPCRLRDVLDLCRDTGLGANAYSVIENRMIDVILSDRAEERRGLFEEAAGIGKYKDRRKAALRRLEAAEVDLARLEDLIAEVESKVRSLARQRSRAQRWEELRARRLAVELAVVREELRAIEQTLEAVEAALSRRGEDRDAVAAALTAAETELEALRIERLEAERARVEAATRVDAVRDQLVRWEKDLAVAEERATHGRRRLAQIEEERSQASQRIQELSAELASLQESRVRLQAETDASASRLAEARIRSEELRVRLGEARHALSASAEREQEIMRRMAQLEGDADAADAQAAELSRHVERLAKDLDATSSTLSALREQGDLFTDRLERLAQDVAAAQAALAEAAGLVADARARALAAREHERAAEDLAGSLEAQHSALAAMERDREGLAPVVAAALAAGDGDVLGTLADFIVVPAGLARSVELYLGPLLHAVVVRDRRSADRMRRWFTESWSAGGGLILLPADSSSVGATHGAALPGGVSGRGAGEGWVRALLAGVELVEESDLLTAGATGRTRLSPSGASIDSLGVIRVGNPLGAAGALERRERMERLAHEKVQAAREAAQARTAREQAEAGVQAAEEAVRARHEALRGAEDRLRGAEAGLAAQQDQHARVDRDQGELLRQLEGARATRDRALQRARDSRNDRAALEAQAATMRAARDAARAALTRSESEWEAARGEEVARGVTAARVGSELDRTVERQRDAELAKGEWTGKVELLDREEQALRAMLAEVEALKARADAELERLFAERDTAEAQLREREATHVAATERVDEVDRKVKAARNAERTTTEERHRLELERQELTQKRQRIHDRIENEWGSPFEALAAETAPAVGEPDALRAELEEIVAGITRLGPINMLAIEEHEEESRRLGFLRDQRTDLVAARDDLRSAIRRINETATRIFQETFAATRTNFQATFARLFEGGEADLWLSEPDDPLESPIEIYASPRGKRTQRIDLLSGGERALTALALLFGIYLVKPSPFCVLDEVDAPLDEANIGRYTRLLEEFKHDTQFVVITHNPRTIEAAESIYGVTMEEPGVSTIVGVRLDDALRANDSAA